MKKVILTGDRPTGKLHLGHYTGSLKLRLDLQDNEEYEMFILIADLQALTDNAKNPTKIRESLLNVALDYLAIGIDPNKVKIFIQSQVPQLAELSFYFMNLISVPRLSRNPTVKSEMKLRKFEVGMPVGFFTYPISQASDILSLNACLVPCGEDQLPMIELTREIAKNFNHTYGDFFVEPEVMLSENKTMRRLPGIDGNEKMSKSLGNAIYLADDEETLRKKVFSMYTDPNHIHVEDPGQVEGNMVFTYLDVFGTDKEKIEEMKAQYRKGGLGDVATKKYLFEVLNNLLKPIRERRKYYEEHIDIVKQILIDGSKYVRERVEENLKVVRNKMGIDYKGVLYE